MHECSFKPLLVPSLLLFQGPEQVPRLGPTLEGTYGVEDVVQGVHLLDNQPTKYTKKEFSK